MDVQTNTKSQTRQGPAFRALVRGLDEENSMCFNFHDFDVS